MNTSPIASGNRPRDSRPAILCTCRVLRPALCALALITLLAKPGSTQAWWGNSDINPTSFGGGWATSGDCGTYWYIFDRFTACSARGFNMTFNCGFAWNGRGYIHLQWVNSGNEADTILTMRYRNQAGGLTGETSTWNDCAHTCSWQSAFDRETCDQYNYNGIYRNADEDVNGGCGSICGFAPEAGREINMYGDKWVYLNDWIVWGGYGNTAGVSTVGWTPPFGESGIYVYGAIDTTHGNYFASNLYGGKTPARVQTGDCGANSSPGNCSYPNYLNFQGNANVGGIGACANCDEYAFCWVNTATGAGPQWGVGSDDGDRIWLNGSLIADNNAARGVTWDQDRFLPAGMVAGWNRVIFKVHQGGGGSGGVISLHNGTDFHQMEPAVTLQGDRYGGFSVGYEQDAWFPTITVTNFSYSFSTPAVAAVFYTNSTGFNAGGTSAASTSPSPGVPYWKTMQYMWGYGLGGVDSNFAPVSGNPTSTTWADVITGVTGHRRFHYFAVSQSGRTSGQASGSTGGWTFDSGHAKYFDVYVDNVAPVNPTFSSVSAASTTSISLGWAIPLDQGVGTANSATEAAGNISNNTDANNYYIRGDVGVQAYRGGSTVVSAWGTGTSATDTGLSPNTQYTYTLQARDNNSGTRGNWNNTTAQTGSTAKYTLSVAPTSSTVSADQSNPGRVVWTAVGGFGAGTLDHYKYVFDQTATHSFSGSEANWSSGTVTGVPTSGGTWYLHVQGFNGDSVANGTFDYSVVAPGAPAVATQPTAQSACYGQNATFTTSASGTTPSYVWLKNSKAGWGSAWTVGASSGGTYLGSSANNNNGGANCNSFSGNADINTSSGNSWGLFGGSSGESLSRNFPSALTSGQVFQIDMDNGGVDSGKQNGFTLQNSSGALLLSFYFNGGGSFYGFTDASGNTTTSVGFTRNGLRVEVIVGNGSPASYTILITPCGGSTVAYAGTFATTGGPAKLVVYNNNTSTGSANDLFFNNLYAGNNYDSADNYSGNWAGLDKGDQAISGATSSSYSTAGNNGDLYYALAFNNAGVTNSLKAQLTITPKALTMSGLSVPASKVYDGTTGATVSGTPALQASETFPGGTCGDGKPFTGDQVGISGAAVGAYNSKDVATASSVTFSSLSITGAQAGSYTFTIQSPASATITTKALTAQGTLSGGGKTYDATTGASPGGSAALQTAESTGTGNTSDGKPYTGNGDSVSLSGTASYAFNSKDVGTATTITASGLSLTGTGSGNYTLTAPTLSASISTKALTMSGLSVPSTKIYDATTGATVSGSPGNLQAAEVAGSGSTSDGKPYTSDTVSLTGTATGTYNSKDVATASSVTFAGVSLTGAQAGDYNLTTQSAAPATITKKSLTMNGLSVPASKVYDATTTAVVSGSPGSLQSAEAPGAGSTADGKPYTGDTVSTTGTATGAYNSKDVPSASSVSFGGVSLTGGQSGNYNLTPQSAASATITAKPLTMSGLSVPASKVYDATTTATVSGSPGNLQSAEAPGAGSTADGKPYTGDTVNLSGTATGTYNSKDVPTASSVSFGGLSLSGGQAPDYSLATESAASATITAKALTMSGLSVPASKVYDGTTGATVSGSPGSLQSAEAPGAGSTGDGMPYTGDTVSVTGSATGTYNSKDVASANSVTFGGVSLAGGQAANYGLATQSAASATISQKPLTISGLSANNKCFDGSTSDPLSGSGTLQATEPAGSGSTGDGKPYNVDSVSADGSPSGAFADSSVGNGKGVTVSGASIVGTGNGNYSPTQPTGLTASIFALPTARNATGGGAFCTGGSGVTVGLDNSDSGINYQLYRNGSAVGSPMAGNGSAISFGAQTVAGTYTIQANNGSTSCRNNMTGNSKVVDSLQTPLKWIDSNGAWQFSTIAGSWQDGATNPATYCDGYDILLDDSASTTSPTISLGTTVAPTSLTNNSTKNYTITGSGSISGSGGLNKLGLSTLTLGCDNTYIGPTVVSAGTLALSGSISNSPNISVGASGTLDVTGRSDGTLALGSGQSLSGGGTVIGVIAVGSGATLFPSGINSLTNTGSTLLQGGGTNVVKVIDAPNAAGVGYDSLTVSGTIGLQATSGNPFNLKLTSLDGTGAPGSVTNFNKDTSYTWTVASGTFTNYDPTLMNLDTSAFSNDLAGGQFLLQQGSIKVVFTNDHGPIAMPTNYTRTAGQTIKINIPSIMANLTSHPDAYARLLHHFESISGAMKSARGYTVITNSTYLFYTNTADNNLDSINYIITDNAPYRPGDSHRFATNSIVISTTTSVTSTNNLSISSGGSGTNILTFAGVPGLTYVAQYATNLGPSALWFDLVTTNAPSSGIWTVIDSNATNDARFYRSKWQY